MDLKGNSDDVTEVQTYSVNVKLVSQKHGIYILCIAASLCRVRQYLVAQKLVDSFGLTWLWI